MYEAGLISLIAVLIILLKFPRGLLRKILWLDVPIDIAVTAMFVALFAGTYSGMMTAAIAGLIFSLSMWGLKCLVGYDVPRFSPRAPFLTWERH